MGEKAFVLKNQGLSKMIGVKQLLNIAAIAAKEAGKAIMEVYISGEFETALKEGEFPVTKADRAAHAIISHHLRKTNLPILSEEGAGIDFEERKKWEYFWLIDPLDGTKEFIQKNGGFTVNIALVHRQEPVGGVIYVPDTDVLYMGSKETGVFKNDQGKYVEFPPSPKRIKWADLLQRGHLTIAVSRSHNSPETEVFINQFLHVSLINIGSSLKFMMLLENKADIYPRMAPTMEWDTAAAHAILNAANRGVYQADLKKELIYNKPLLINPFFIAF